MEYKNLNGGKASDKIAVYNCDCMDLLKQTPDNYYELSIVDPPYGLGMDKSRNSNKGNKAGFKIYHDTDWDSKSPNKEYFNELIRVSKNQIIWGANHFISKIPYDSSCWIVWDKKNGDSDNADAELAWTSFKTAVRKYTIHISKTFKDRIHPTQKPIYLYEWILMNYAKEGDKIVDTHRGSASLDIACHNLGFDLWTCELDTDYFNDGNKRLKQHQNQLKMF